MSMNTYAIARSTSPGHRAKRKYYSGLNEKGKPVYLSFPKDKLWSYGNIVQTYTDRSNARRALKRLEGVDRSEFWRDSRRQNGYFHIVEI